MEQAKMEVTAVETTITKREVSIVVTKQGNYPKRAEHFKGIAETAIIVKLTDKYKSSKLPLTGMSPEELYEVSRHDLRLRPERVLNATLVIVVCNCRVLEVYICLFYIFYSQSPTSPSMLISIFSCSGLELRVTVMVC